MLVKGGTVPGQFSSGQLWKRTMADFRFRALSSERKALDELLISLARYLDANAVDEIHDACRFGIEAHAGQTRVSGEAYINHPLAVAGILGEMRMDSRTIIAAVLHDVIEDTAITLTQLTDQFGEDVAELVDGVSKISLLEQGPSEHAEAASFYKMFMATAKDIRVIIIKLADRLHNMQTLKVLKEEKKRRVARQTMEIYAPIANRLGMRDVAQKLENLSLQNLYPKRYEAISKKIISIKRGKLAVNNLCGNIQQKLSDVGITANVYGEQESIYAIYRKIQQKKLRLKDMQSIHVVRVITETRLQCYQALGMTHQLYKPHPSSFNDYVAIPKVNGYQALHTTIIDPAGRSISIQIRSQAMHRVAEKGITSHWLYKIETTGEHAPQQLAKEWLHSFLESQQKSADSREFLEHLKADLFPDEVYVFTPKGDIKRLPRGATAVDFAYAVHTDVGTRSAGARIGQRLVPLHTVLRNGDHVEIMTSRSARPLPACLDYAITSKARASIRHSLSHRKGKEATKLGRKLLGQALSKQGYRRLRIQSNHKTALLKHLQIDDWEELLGDIGFGRRPPALVAKQFITEIGGVTIADDHEPSVMCVEGTERLLVSYADCCHPIPGDHIIGTMVSGKGLSVHRSNCPNHKEFMRHHDNYFDLKWSESTQQKFQVVMNLETDNRPGVLAAISNIISAYDSNVRHLQVTSQHRNISSMSFIIEVTDRKHLAVIMRELRTEESVIQLSRA